MAAAAAIAANDAAAATCVEMDGMGEREREREREEIRDTSIRASGEASRQWVCDVKMSLSGPMAERNSEWERPIG